MAKAKDMLEDVYKTRLNENQSYYKQMERLDAAGALSSRTFMLVLFRLCELVDEQEAEIKELKKAA